VLEALDHDDRRALREEIGDFIFEGVLLAQVCAESGDFTVADSLHAISTSSSGAIRTSSGLPTRAPIASRFRRRPTKSWSAGRA